jgi:hypothetical protein
MKVPCLTMDDRNKIPRARERRDLAEEMFFQVPVKFKP